MMSLFDARGRPLVMVALCIAVALAALFPSMTRASPGPGGDVPALRDAVSRAGDRDVAASVALTLPSPGGATRLMAAADDLYLVTPNLVLRYTLHGLPYALQFTNVMRWREDDNKVVMGQPLDLFLAGERLLILDSLGSLWSYVGPTFERVLAPLRLQSDQGTPVAVLLHGTTLLLLDPQRGQIWSYAPAGAGVDSGYDTVPRPLLPRPSALLSKAVRLTATATALLALCSDGSVVSVPWVRPLAARLPIADSLVGLWSSPVAPGMLGVTGQDILALDAAGQVTQRLRPSGLDGETIVDVAESPAGQLYVLTATRVLLVHARVAPHPPTPSP